MIFKDERIRPLVVGVNKSIYVFGGYTDRNKEVRYLDTAARFDTIDGTWKFLSPMEYARSGGQVRASPCISILNSLCKLFFN